MPVHHAVAAPGTPVDRARGVAVRIRIRDGRRAGTGQQQLAAIVPHLERQWLHAVVAVGVERWHCCRASLYKPREPFEVEHEQGASGLLQAHVGEFIDLGACLVVARDQHRHPYQQRAADQQQQQAALQREPRHGSSRGIR